MQRFRFPRSKRGLASVAITAVILSMLTVVGVGIQPAAAAACGAGNVGVTPLQGNIFYADFSPSPSSLPKLEGMYEGFRFTNNTGGALAGAWANVDTFTAASGAASVTLAPSEDGVDQLSTLADGSSDNSYFFLKTSAATTVAQTHTVHVYDRRPDLAGAVELCSTTFTYAQVTGTIQASANKVDTSTETSNPPGLGAIMTMTVKGHTGTIGSGESFDPRVFQMSPATVVTGTPTIGAWPANVYELETVKVNIDLNDGAGVVDHLDFLHWQFTGTPGDRPYTIVYTFRIVGTTAANTSVSPVQYISSGTQTKHTDMSNYATTSEIQPIQPTINGTSLAKSASPTKIPATGGTVTYTVTATNALLADAAILDSFTDTLPTGTTYVNNTATFNGVTIADPIISGSTLTFIGPFTVPANSSRSLTYQASIAAGSGTRINSVIGKVGSTQLDTTIATTDNSPATATVTLQAAPVANDDSYSTAYVTPLTVSAPGTLGNDTGTSITVTNHTNPASGSLTINANGSFTYTPNAGFAGIDTFTYTVSDDIGQTSTAKVSITVGSPAAPDAVDNNYTTTVNTPRTVTAPGVLGNDSGSGITVTGHTNPTHGSLTINPNGSFAYTPTSGFTGMDTFTYTITDAVGQTDTATVTITVTPDAIDDAYNATAGQTLTVLATGVLGNDLGSSSTVTNHTNPANGSLTIDGTGSFVYTPMAGFSGTDTFTYTITDSSGQSDAATVTITVAPDAIADAYSVATGGTLTVPTTGVLGNDSGLGLAVTAHTNPSKGSLTIDGNGSFVYTPNAGTSGTDTFTYTITDSSGQTDTTTVTITVTPTAADDVYSATAGQTLNVPTTGVLGNDAGSGLAVMAHTDTTYGSLSLNTDGSFDYTPDAGFSGTDTFTYTVTDSSGQTTTASVTITVDPDAIDDAYATSSGTPLTVVAPGVLGNDRGSSPAVVSNADPANGSASVDADGSFTYTPDASFSGIDTFTYTLEDAEGNTDVATVTITVTPQASDDAYGTPAGTPLTVSAPGVLGNDSGSDLAVTDHTAPANGSVSVDAGGSFTYTPDAGFSGIDTFSYEITDGSGQTDTAIVTITVTPNAVDDAYSTVAGSPLTVTAPGVHANDSGSGITLTDHTDPAHGVLVLQPDGSFTYTPTGSFVGTDTFTYEITDASDQTDTATVTIQVTNQPPVAVDDDVAAGSNTPTNVTVLANDSDPDGHTLTLTGVGSPASGGAAVRVGNVVQYTPPTNFTGYDVFPYTISDGFGGTATALVHVYVGPTTGGLVGNDKMTRFTLGGTVPGTASGTYDRMSLGSPLRLSTQQLVVTLRNGFTPSPGDTFDIVVAPGISGAYASVFGQVLPNGLVLEVRYLPDRVRLVAVTGRFVDTTTDAVDASPGDGACATAADDCSLRAAVMEANASAGGDAIVLAPKATYTLALGGAGEDAAAIGDLDVSGAAAFVGQSATIGGGGIDRILDVLPGATVTVTRLGLTNGDAPAGVGGGLRAQGTSIHLTDTVVQANHAPTGGGLGVDGGSLTMVRGSVMTNTAATGGGVAATAGTVLLDTVAVGSNSAPGGLGGGVLASGTSTVTVSTGTISTNNAGSGAGVATTGSATVVVGTTTVSANIATVGGGGLANAATATLTQVRMVANAAPDGAGATNSGSLTLRRVTLDANTATVRGGALTNTGALLVDTSTFSGNTAPTGAALSAVGGTAAITSATLTANKATAGAAVQVSSGAIVRFANSIVANQVIGVGCAAPSGGLSSLGYNLGSDATCALTATQDVQNTGANLGPLAANGGYSPTHKPATGSLAINTGPTTCAGPDQRAFARPRGARCDKGAVEI